MGKAGTPLSGTKRVQRYRCSKCGTTSTNPFEYSKNGMKYIKLGIDELHYTQLFLRALKARVPLEDYVITQLFREH